MMQEPLPNSSTKTIISDGALDGFVDESLDQSGGKQQTSTLIEFPGTSRTVPEWRKQLSQRVREVQERKAREAAEELAAAQQAGLVSCVLPSAQLELVPDLEQPVRNPIVSKALERIERARRTDEHVATGFAGAATAAAPALAPVADTTSEPTPETTLATTIDPPAPVETKPRLTVVAPSKPQVESTDRKPVRVISEGVDHVALSYLETCLSVPPIASATGTQSAPFKRRFIAGTLDLALTALLACPFAAAVEFADGNWADPRVIGLMSGITLFLMFAYLTISIALTGRTVGMRMLSLRTIDTRTGMIPTGGQAMKRAIGYIFGLAFLGLGVIYGLVDPDRRTVYDRFSKTIVIQD